MGYVTNELQQPLAAMQSHLQAAKLGLRLIASKQRSDREGASERGREGGEGAGEGASAVVSDACGSLDRALGCCSLMGTVVNDVANIRSMEAGRMMLAVDTVDVKEIMDEVRPSP